MFVADMRKLGAPRHHPPGVVELQLWKRAKRAEEQASAEWQKV